MSLAKNVSEAIVQDVDYNGWTQDQMKRESEFLLHKVHDVTKKEFVDKCIVDPQAATSWFIEKFPDFIYRKDSVRYVANAIKNGYITIKF